MTTNYQTSEEKLIDKNIAENIIKQLKQKTVAESKAILEYVSSFIQENSYLKYQ